MEGIFTKLEHNCNDKKWNGKIQKVIQLTKNVSPTPDSGAMSLSPSVILLCILERFQIILEKM